MRVLWRSRLMGVALPRLLFAALFVLTLIAVILSKADVSITAPANLRDVQGHWAQNCIQELVQRQVLAGYPDNTFRPENPVTRAEFAAMVNRAFPQTPKVRQPISFKDVPAKFWAAQPIQYAYQTGFLSGYPGDRFNPNEAIVRVQALGSLAGGKRYTRVNAADETLPKAFDDAGAIPTYARDAIAAGLENRLIVNYPNVKTLKPNQPATRGEIAAFFCQALLPDRALIPATYIAAGVPPVDFEVPNETPISRSEIRGVWLTNVDSDVLTDATVLTQAVDELRQLNFNTLYPTVWNWGTTLYPSTVMQRAIGRDMDLRAEDIGLTGRNMLSEIVTAGRKQGMTVIPWFEFGFMTPSYSELARQRPEWLTKRQDGSVVWMEGIHPRVWLNPFKPEVQQFIQDLVLEIVEKYDVDGIQFDDHFGLPIDFGYDEFTLALYKQENPNKSMPPAPNDPDWVRWRANKITKFLETMFRAIKQRKSQVIVSLSPNPYPFAYSQHLQDWVTWERQGLIEELVVQIYRNDLKSFVEALQHPSIQDARKHIPTGVGILTGLKDRTIPMQQVRQKVWAVRNRQFSGVSFFFYETLWKMSDEAADDRKAALQTLLNPAVPRPNLVQGWVPPQ